MSLELAHLGTPAMSALPPLLEVKAAINPAEASAVIRLTGIGANRAP